MNKRKGMPNAKAILWAWQTKLWGVPENDYDARKDWLNTCWACGFKGKLQRCHIHAVQYGGSNSAENLVLLCEPCHKRQEEECITDIGRQNFVDALIDGAMYMEIRYRELMNRAKRMPKAELISILDKALQSNKITQAQYDEMSTNGMAMIYGEVTP